MRIVLIFLMIFLNTYVYAKTKPHLLIYCGITMYKPIKKMADIIKKKDNCDIDIIQGGSKDLLDSLEYSKRGDIFLPGSDRYIKSFEKRGLIIDKKFIGYNQAAIFVQKGNPKKIKNLEDLLRKDVAIILCDPQSGSIGAMTKKMLISYKGEKFFNKAYLKAAEIGTDSRNLNSVLIDKDADMTINWIATSYWKENRDFIDVIKLDSTIAPKKKLILGILKFSKYPEIAKDFLKFASSKEGLKIMKDYGF